MAKGVRGTLRIARISLADASRDEYVVDPEFRDWYEPLPTSLRQPIDDGCQAIRVALVKLDPASPSLENTVQEILRRSDGLRQRIVQDHAVQGCRRVLRDLETIDRHMNVVGRSCRP